MEVSSLRSRTSSSERRSRSKVGQTYRVHHGHQHAVLKRVTSILHNRDDVGAALGTVDEITARMVRELNGVDSALRADDIRAVRYGGTRGSTQVQQLGAGANVDVLERAF